MLEAKDFLADRRPIRPFRARPQDLAPNALVAGLAKDHLVRIASTSPFRNGLLLVEFDAPEGGLAYRILDEASCRQLRIHQRGLQMGFRYPAGVSRLFQTKDDALKILGDARRDRLLHPIAQAYLAEVAARLSTKMETVNEIYAVAGARNDALSVGIGKAILWEVFGTAGRVEEDLRKLERMEGKDVVSVAVVLDREVDGRLYEKFVRAVQGSRVRHWVTVSDLMVTGRFEETVAMLDRALSERGGEAGPVERLVAVSFRLRSDMEHWHADSPTRAGPYAVPFGFVGGSSERGLVDPVFDLDVQNQGQRQVRIWGAYLNVRFRHTKLHGMYGPGHLRPSCDISLPLDDGKEGYREVEISDPVLVESGQHARIRLRLTDAGFAWRGEVEIGLLYGAENDRRFCRGAVVSLFV